MLCISGQGNAQRQQQQQQEAVFDTPFTGLEFVPLGMCDGCTVFVCWVFVLCANYAPIQCKVHGFVSVRNVYT